MVPPASGLVEAPGRRWAPDSVGAAGAAGGGALGLWLGLLGMVVGRSRGCRRGGRGGSGNDGHHCGERRDEAPPRAGE